MLRKLVGLGGAKRFVLPHGFSDDHLAEALKLDSWIDGQGPALDIGRIRAELRRMHIAAEGRRRRTTRLGATGFGIRRLESLASICFQRRYPTSDIGAKRTSELLSCRRSPTLLPPEGGLAPAGSQR